MAQLPLQLIPQLPPAQLQPLRPPRDPLRLTQVDLLPLPFQPINYRSPQIINTEDQFNRMTTLGNSKHINTSGLIALDNVQRSFENMKLQTLLSTGRINYNKYLKEWSKNAANHQFNKYGMEKEPVQIDEPFKRYREPLNYSLETNN